MFCLRTFCLYGRFVPPDVLFLRTFCPYGRFVSTDVLSLRTFCPTDVMSPAVLSPDVLSPDVLSLRTFCLRTFCLGTVFMTQVLEAVLVHVTCKCCISGLLTQFLSCLFVYCTPFCVCGCSSWSKSGGWHWTTKRWSIRGQRGHQHQSGSHLCQEDRQRRGKDQARIPGARSTPACLPRRFEPHQRGQHCVNSAV